MAMTTITPASFTRINSTAPDALAMRNLEQEFRTYTIACGQVVALYSNAQELADAPEIKAALKAQNTFNDHATRALPEPLADGASVQAREDYKALKTSIIAARDKVELIKRTLTTAGSPEVLAAVLGEEWIQDPLSDIYARIKRQSQTDPATLSALLEGLSNPVHGETLPDMLARHVRTANVLGAKLPPELRLELLRNAFIAMSPENMPIAIMWESTTPAAQRTYTNLHDYLVDFASKYKGRPTASALTAKAEPPAAAMATSVKPPSYLLITKEAIDKAPTKTLKGLVRSLQQTIDKREREAKATGSS